MEVAKDDPSLFDQPLLCALPPPQNKKSVQVIRLPFPPFPTSLSPFLHFPDSKERLTRMADGMKGTHRGSDRDDLWSWTRVRDEHAV